MRSIKIVAALAIMALPNLAFASVLANSFDAKFSLPKKANEPIGYLAANANQVPMAKQSPDLMVPTLSQLNDEIDRGNTAVERKPLPNFKLSPSTKKIIKQLPPKLTKTGAKPKGKESLTTKDFNGKPEEKPVTPEIKEPTIDAINTGKIDPEKAKKDSRDPTQKTFQIVVNPAPGIEGRSKDVDVLRLAARAYAVGQYESAIALYKSALARQPDGRNALFGLATSYHRNGQKTQAKTYYSRLLTLYPYDTEGQNNFLTLVAEEAPQDALKELDELARANPSYGAIFAQKAMIYLKQGDDRNAIKNLYQAVKLEPDNNNYKYNLAVLFDKNGYYQNAALLYENLFEQSLKGIQIPASREQISDRMTYIKSKINTTGDEKKI